MRTILSVASFGLFALLGFGAVAADTSPYVGQQGRAIKALSAQEVDDLVNGRGMGLAKAAELNRYPGPRHVLDMASELKLTPEQQRAIADIFDRMSAAAKPIGADILTREQRLDHEFAAGGIAKPQLVAETEELGILEGRLRAVHLGAHLETKALLTPDQIARYSELRGYDSPAVPAMPEHMHQGG
jgi:Spy/CpxP family protein refolding chaperone